MYGGSGVAVAAPDEKLCPCTFTSPCSSGALAFFFELEQNFIRVQMPTASTIKHSNFSCLLRCITTMN